MTIEEMESSPCCQVFKLGLSKRYLSMLMVKIPGIVQTSDGSDDMLGVQAYLLDAGIPFLCAKRRLELWQSKVDTERRILETEIDGKQRDLKMMIMTGSHYGIILEKEGRKSIDVLFLED